jgi:hypothetical protein
LVVFTKYLSASHLASSARYSSIIGKTSWTHSSKTQYELAFNRVYMCNTNSMQSWLQFKRCPTWAEYFKHWFYSQLEKRKETKENSILNLSSSISSIFILGRALCLVLSSFMTYHRVYN